MTATIDRAKVARERKAPLEELVDYFDSVKVDTRQLGGRGVRFGDTIPAISAFTEGLSGLSAESDGVYLGMHELAWPVNQGVVLDNLTVHSMRTVTPREARGRVLGVHPRLVEWNMVTQPHRGGVRAAAMRAYLAVDSDYRCRDVSNHSYDPARNGRQEIGNLGNDVLDILCGLQAQAYYEWHVAVLTGSGMFLRIPTTPKMAQALVSQRDLPRGLTRRQAIRHLVSAHARRTKSGETKVSEHLRGKQRFTWEGLSGFVAPSRYDVDRISK